MTEYQTLIADQQGTNLFLTLNRPAARNALNPTMISELEDLFAKLRSNPAVKTVILRGSGGHFCAGADLKMLGQSTAPQPGKPDPLAVENRRFGALLESVMDAPQVVVAVIEGYALAGGLGLACASDVAILRSDAHFGITEVALGLVPAQMGPFVAMRIGASNARRLALTSARFDAKEALRLGIGHFLAADANEMDFLLTKILGQIDHGAPMALAATKAIFNEAIRKPLPAALDFAAETLAITLRGPEASEGMRAFAEKRRPKWTART